MSTEAHPEIPFLVEKYPPLSDDLVGTAAVNGQLVKYPKVVRQLEDPPIGGQTFTNISFMLLKDPKVLENGKRVYGYVKNRGNWPSEQAAIRDGERIIKEIDSRFEVKVGMVGEWLPITEDDERVRDKIDVVTDDEAHKPQLRDEAARQKRAEQRRMQKELAEAEQALREEEEDTTPLEEKEKTLDGYTTKRVTEMKMLEMHEKYLYQLKALEYNMRRIAHELGTLEKSHPEYAEDWLENYNASRRKYGTPDYVPSKKEIEYHDRSVGEADLSKPYPFDEELRYAKMAMI